MIWKPKKEKGRTKLTAGLSASEALSAVPKLSYLSGVNSLARVAGGKVEPSFSVAGELHTLCGENLFSEKFTGNAVEYATRFLNSKEAKRAFGLRYVTLVPGAVQESEFFTRVEFKQVTNLPGFAPAIDVRGGFVHVFVNKKGKIIHVNSTVRRGTKPPALGTIITAQRAIELAQAKLGVTACEAPRCTLVLSSHEGHMDPVYEVLLSVCKPRQLRMYLVKAKTGQIVYDENKLIFAKSARGRGRGRASLKGIKARTFARIPENRPREPISKQVSDVLIDPTELPDPAVLANSRYVMKVLRNGKWQTVKANDKGTFEFDPLSDDPTEVSKFSAVLTFIWLNTQDATFEEWGAVKVPNPIPVFVDDPEVSDNAFFDPEAWEIHLGVGTGVKGGGLDIHIVWDPGVSCHENVHKRNAAEAPGKDLPGRQGRAAGEATADAFGDLLFDFWMRHKNGDVLGHTLTVEDIMGDPAIIGKYAGAPRGLRSQRNKKQFPRDIVNEEHDDGLIIGGAFFDLLVAMAAVPGADVASLLMTYGKIYINGTRLLPAHKVLFTDYLPAFATADSEITGGVNKALIEQAFAHHNIKPLPISSRKKSPSKKKAPSRRKGPSGKNGPAHKKSPPGKKGPGHKKAA